MKPLNLFKPLPLAAMISLFAAGQAHAFTPGVSCYGSDASSTCELRIANNLSLQTTVGHLLDKYNGEYQLSGTVMIVSGAARFPMQEADIVVNLTAQPEVYGTAVIPFDKMSGMEKATFETLPRVVVGLVQGDNIETLIGKDIPLNDDVSESGSHRGEGQPYFVFHADAGLAMSYDFGKDAEILNNFVFTMPGSVSATAIFDAADPYIYWSYDKTEGIDLNGLKKNEQYGSTEYDLYDDQGNLMMRYTQVDNGELYEQNFVTGEMFIYTRDSDGNYVMDGSDPANPVVLDGRQFDGSNGRRIERTTDSNPEEQKGSGADIGAFGVSLHGWIPFEAQSAEGLPADAGEFSGQLALSGTIPMGGGVNLEGDVITYIGEHGFAQGGNGDVSWGLPFVPDFISFDIELGAASAVLKVTDYEQMTYVSGEVKPDSAFLQDLLPIMPQAGAKVQGYIGNQLQETFIAIEGAMGMGADTFGDWIGVDLNDLSLTSASMRVTADGFTVDGKTLMQIHPAIQIHSEVNVHAAMSWINPQDVVLRLSGDMNIYGVALEDVIVEISGHGMFVNGAFVTPVSRIAMSGKIDNSGADIRGSGSLVLDMGAITGAMRDAYDAMTAAQAEVAKISYAIEAMRNTVQAERDRDAQKLADARSDVTAAQAEINRINSLISYEYSRINTRKAEISSWYNWYKKAAWYEKATRYARYVYEKGWRSAEIAGRYTLIGTYKASLLIADAALEVAKWSLSTAEAAIVTLPVDADPRIVALFTARESAMLALEIAKAPFNNVPLINGSFAANIALSLGTSGIDGTVSANFDGYSLLQGKLAFAPRFEACLTIPGLGDACTPF